MTLWLSCRGGLLALIIPLQSPCTRNAGNALAIKKALDSPMVWAFLLGLPRIHILPIRIGDFDQLLSIISHGSLEATSRDADRCDPRC